MCAPVLLIAAATALSAASAVVTGVGAVNQANYEAGVANTNATYAQRAAADAQARGDIAEKDQWQKVAQLKGQQQVALGAMGIDASFGSALDIQKDTAIGGAQDALAVRQNTQNEVQGFVIQGANDHAEAAAAKARASSAAFSTVLNVGSSIVGGASQAYGAADKFGSLGSSSAALTSRGIGSSGASYYGSKLGQGIR